MLCRLMDFGDVSGHTLATFTRDCGNSLRAVIWEMELGASTPLARAFRAEGVLRREDMARIYLEYLYFYLCRRRAEESPELAPDLDLYSPEGRQEETAN